MECMSAYHSSSTHVMPRTRTHRQSVAGCSLTGSLTAYAPYHVILYLSAYLCYLDCGSVFHCQAASYELGVHMTAPWKHRCRLALVKPLAPDTVRSQYTRAGPAASGAPPTMCILCCSPCTPSPARKRGRSMLGLLDPCLPTYVRARQVILCVCVTHSLPVCRARLCYRHLC